VAIAASRREQLASAKQYGQCWFANGSREEAMRFVQGEIGKARSRITIADPYLAGLQLGQFLYAVNGDTVAVTLLTSSLAFNSKGGNQSKLDMLDNFKNRLDDLANHQKIVANVYVIAASVLHDRFLVVDNAVWFLGNSLNALGDKASMIVKLPNPDEVIDQLKIMQDEAKSFDCYRSVQSRTSAQATE
jgi:hypothetical protein